MYRLAMAVLLAPFLVTSSTQNLQDPQRTSLKIYISADMEGVVGADVVDRWQFVSCRCNAC